MTYGPSAGQVEDSYLYEHVHGRPIGFEMTSADREYRLRRENTDNCGNCGQQVLWVWHEGYRRAVDSFGEELDVVMEGHRLRTRPGVTHGIHECRS